MKKSKLPELKVLLIIFTTLFSFLGCKDTNNSPPSIVKNIDTNYSDTYSLKLVDSLIIKTPPQCYSKYHSLALYNDSLIFAVNQHSFNIIDVFDIKKKKYIKSITISEDLLNDRVSGLYIKAIDSIYFCQSSPPEIFLVNFNGNIIDKWSNNDLIIKTKSFPKLSSSQIHFNTYMGTHLPAMSKNYFFVSTDPKGFNYKYPQIKRIGQYDLLERKWKNFIGGGEEVPFYNLKNCFPHDLEQPYFLINDSNLLLNYPMDHLIYEYDIISGEFLNAKPAKSRYEISFPSPVKRKDISECQKSLNFRIQTPFYSPLFYHKNLDMYSRVVHFTQDLVGDDGNLNNGQKRISSIILLDKDLNIVGEKIFKDGLLGVNSYIPIGSGFIIGKQTDQEKDENLSYNKEYIIIKK